MVPTLAAKTVLVALFMRYRSRSVATPFHGSAHCRSTTREPLLGSV